MPTVIRKKPPTLADPIDWDQFADGKSRLFIPGKDFQGDAETFRNRARNAAARRGLKSRTWTEDGGIAVAFFPQPPTRKRSSKKA